MKTKVKKCKECSFEVELTILGPTAYRVDVSDEVLPRTFVSKSKANTYITEVMSRHECQP